MIFVLSLVFSCMISMSFSYFIKNRKIYLSIIAFSYSFAFFFMCVFFFVIKFNGENILIFPDEGLYVNDYTSVLPFSVYVRTVNELLGQDAIRLINIFIFSTSLALLSSDVMGRVESETHKIYIAFFSLFGVIVGGYWSYFILKEAFSIAAISFLMVATLRKSWLFLTNSLIFLALARPDLFTLYAGIIFIFYIREKNRSLYKLIVVGAILITIWFMNSDLSYRIKIFTLSKRFGELNVTYDSTTLAVSQYSFIPFILSDAFHQAIITNLKSSFNPFHEINALTIVQRTFNVLAIILFIKCFFSSFLKDKVYTFIFIVIVGLICTHSVYRYMNTLLIPFSIYSIYLIDLKKRRAKIEKNIGHNTRL